jgi:glycine/D-amino acid oxidase-like deaminating enzyme
LPPGPCDRDISEHDSFATLTARGHTLERLDAGASSRFPAFTASRYPDGYFNPDAGWVESGRALAKMIDEAKGQACAWPPEMGSRG